MMGKLSCFYALLVWYLVETQKRNLFKRSLNCMLLLKVKLTSGNETWIHDQIYQRGDLLLKKQISIVQTIIHA